MATNYGNRIIDSVKVTATATLTRFLMGQLDGTLASTGEYGFPILFDAVSGDTTTLQTMGIGVATAGGSITAGNLLACDSAGKLVAASALSATVPSSGTTVTSSSAQPAMTMAGGVTPQIIVGIALNDASSDGQVQFIIK